MLVQRFAICAQALRSFCRALHINPANVELRDDDLMWAAELVHRKVSFDSENPVLASSSSPLAAAVVADDCEADDDDRCSSSDEPFVHELKNLPPNCVVIRD